jgi:hypothetical protein
MMIGMIVAAVAFGPNLKNAGPVDTCRVASMSELRQTIDAVLQQDSAITRIELASDLAANWRLECLSAEERQADVARQFGRFLAYPELRQYATEALYALGTSVTSAKREIHRAYVDQSADISRRSKIVPIITGSDIAVWHGLKCLDGRARFGIVSKKHCKYISVR